MISPNQKLSIPESCLPNIDQASIVENSIIASDKQKQKKLNVN
ncbi:12241_t:CDS:2 [Ambispora leptoticha]|uniref:12241_t:CDS:1 n=1 Tax=Ambispora leptoticha TaxID=144679 RepID=A0A9N9BVP8_9GLOM|nr:12241_t:CDS:2 [Ambispora leptoticha]